SLRHFMNITLREVYQTNPDGDRFWKLKECYIRREYAISGYQRRFWTVSKMNRTEREKRGGMHGVEGCPIEEEEVHQHEEVAEVVERLCVAEEGEDVEHRHNDYLSFRFRCIRILNFWSSPGIPPLNGFPNLSITHVGGSPQEQASWLFAQTRSTPRIHVDAVRVQLKEAVYLPNGTLSEA
ncbi:hypothetical protein MPER_05548, partial [Moniliophthora perniciosa FA553]